MLSEAKHPCSFPEKTTAETLRCAQGDRSLKKIQNSVESLHFSTLNSRLSTFSTDREISCAGREFVLVMVRPWVEV